MKLKKVISILVIAFMMVQMMPLNIMAVSETDDQGTVLEEQLPETGGGAGEESQDKEETDREPGETDTVASGETANVKQDADAGKNEQTPADDPDEEQDSDADFIRNKKIEAADVQGEAAESRKAARAALLEQTDISSEDVTDTVNELFDVLRDGEAAEAGEDDDDPPRSGDGSNIETITAKWVTADSVDNDDPALLYRKPDRLETQSVRLQINYALSGEHKYDPGDITITVPAYIFKNRNGADYGEIMVPYPEDPSMRGDYNWKQVGDKIIITNTKRMSAATKGYIQLQYDGLSPQELVDMQTSEPFDAYIEVKTHLDNIIALRSNELTAQFDTEAKLTNVNKGVNKVSRVGAAQIPESQRVGDESEYIKVDWYVWGTTQANTYYTITQTDSIPQDKVVESRVVVADDSFEDANKQISLSDAREQYPDKNYQIGDKVVLKTESDINGFVIGGDSSDSTSVTKQDMYRGYKDGNGSYYYFSTAYPASQFKPDIQYTFHNTINYTVKEVDPEVSENTNPNVQETDPQLVTGEDKFATAQVTWSYSDPKWIEPGGHYMVHKNGNDDTENRNITHKSRYTYNDLHLNGDGYYGIYPSALNRLQDEYKDNGTEGSVRLSYTINTIGYTLPWMYDGGIAEFKEGEFPTRIIGNYNRPITMTTTDTGINIGRNTSKLTVLEDYTFEEIEFPNTPYVYKGKPQNLNPDGTWTAATAGDGTFKYTRDSVMANWPDITLQIQRDGEWIDWAVASWKTGSRVVTLTSGGTAANGIVKVPEDTQNFRTVVTTHNTVGGEGAEEAIQAGIEYDVRAVINLKSTESLIAQIEDAFTKSNLPQMTVYNGVNMLIERADEEPDSEGRFIHSIDREGYDSIRGYTTDTSVYPYKEAVQNLREVDYEARTILIHYTGKVEIRSIINEKKTWQEAVDEGRLTADRHGVWRDLLPKGVTPDLSTITLRSGDRVTDAYTIENYEGSGRTLLVVECDLTPTPVTYRSGDMTYYEDVPTIKFDAIYDFESLKDFGYSIHNVISFESSNDHLGTVKDYSGEPDDPRYINPETNKNNNAGTARAFASEAEKDLMTDLDPDRNDPSFVYAGATTKIDILNAARTSLYKDVQVNNDGIWSDGTYYRQWYGNETEATEGGRMRTVYEGGQYSYRLRVMSDPDTVSTGLIIFDSLENFYAQGDKENPLDSDNDVIDVEAPRWHGVLREVDTSQLEELGCDPVVYYSLQENLQLSDEEDAEEAHEENVDLSNRNIWVRADEYTGEMSAVKAVAVDCRRAKENADPKNKDGNGYFRLQPLQSAVVFLRMQAPSGEEAREIIAQGHESDYSVDDYGDSAMAYNNSYLLCTSMDEDEVTDYDDSMMWSFVRKDYTKVGLKEYSVKASKIWNDDKDRDGIRPKTLTFTLYADGEPVTDEDGENVTRTIDVEAGDKEVVFEHIPYTWPDGEKIHYTIQEEEIEGYEEAHELKDETSYVFTNTHEPEKVSFSGSKTWEGDNDDVRPQSIDVILYANGKELKRQTVKPDPQGEWNYEFTDLFKNENGEEIVYTIKEAKTKNTGDELDSYVTEITPEGSYEANVHNIYHPYGDLDVTKTIQDTTPVSAEKSFAFTFTFTKIEERDGAETEVPISEDEEFDYEVLDENGEPVVDDSGEAVIGKVGNNSTVEIKGGQTIHVKEIPERINYAVSEADRPGFTMTGKTGDSGEIEPNDTAEAEFTNRYSASGQVSLGAQKKLYNRILNKYQFMYELYELGQNEDGEETEELLRTASNDSPSVKEYRPEDGTVDYSMADVIFGGIRYTQEDHGKIFRYKVVEVDSGKAGYTYGEDPEGNKTELYTVEVKVTDNGDGTLKIEPTYKAADGSEVETARFDNTYRANGDITLRAWKNLPGRDLTEGEFTFELLDKNGDPVMNSSAEAGTDEPGTDEEAADGGDAVDADDQGSEDDDQETTDEGTPVTAVNNTDGTVVFTPDNVEALNYTEKDIGRTFYYAIREKKGTDKTVTYDETVFGYMVTIVDNGDGTLFAEQKLMKPVIDDETGKITDWTEIGASLPVFENELKDGRFSIQKTVENPDEAPDQEFHFKVKLIGENVTDDTITGYALTGIDDDPEPPATEDGEQDQEPADNQGSDQGQQPAQDNTDTESQGTDETNNDHGEQNTSRSLRTAGDETVIHSDADSWKAGCELDGSGGVNWRILSDGTLIIGKEGEIQAFRHEAARWAYQSNNSYSKTTKVYDRRGAFLGLSSASHHPFYPWLEYEKEIKKVCFEGTVKGDGDMNGMFSMCINLEIADLKGFDTSNANGLGYLFYGDSKLTTVKHMDTLDTTKMTWMNYAFSGCSSLKEVDLSGIKTPSNTYFGWFLNGCSSLEYADLSGFDQTSPRVVTQYTTSANATMYMNNFFDNCTKLSTVVLGPKFSFKSRTNTDSYSTLPTPPNGQKWVRQEGDPGTLGSYTSDQLRNNYTSSWAGTWVWSGKTFYTVHFLADGAAGGTAPTRMLVGTDSALPANTFVKYGYDFDHWVVTDKDGNPISVGGSEKTYLDEEVIPANTYEMNDHVYLKAVFKQRDTSVDMHDGEFELTLKNGEKATFFNIPAGTAYQVYEETPNGWVLVSQENASGIIEPLVTSQAKFVNRYEPGTTSAQFFGTKTLDNKAAGAGAFTFILKENGEEIQRKSTLEGGFIQFDPIVYKKAGTHTYTIEEADPGNDAVDYDTHIETVTVTVTDDNEGNLSAVTTYDDDGVRFANKTRPGSLKITKVGEGASESNNKEFTFKVTLTNADGMPLGEGDSIYWYKEGEKAPAADNTEENNDEGGDDSGTENSDVTNNGNRKVLSMNAASRMLTLNAGSTKAVQVTTQNFGYTGAYQTYTVPASGYYQIEAWGAQGGNSSLDNGRRDSSYLLNNARTELGHAHGGCGGYTKGKIYLTAGTVLYVYVGGKGTDGKGRTNASGGWNGGGIGVWDGQTGEYNGNYGYPREPGNETDGGGGGATDIRLVSGEWNDFNSLKSRVMVAGGGGGASDTGHGGDAGGIRSTNGITGSHTYSNYSVCVATQTSGNAFGIGQDGSLLYANFPSAGGGGGWYGGKHPALEYGSDNYIWQNPGAGGSSFISGHSGCNAIAENSTKYNIIHTGQSNFYDNKFVFTETQMIAGYNNMPDPNGGTETRGHEGNGYAKITPLSRSITYDPNGGTGSSQTIEYEAGSLVVPHASDLIFDKSNSVFIGWAKNADATVPDFEAGEDVCESIGTTSKLYAVWMGENEYLLHLDANGGFADKQYIRVESPDTVVELPTPENPGKTFDGWDTDQNGSGDRFNSTVTGTQINAEPGKTYTLYAQWLDGDAYARYRIEYHRMNASGEGYSLYETDYKTGRRGETFTAEEKDYVGYALSSRDPESEDGTYTIPSAGMPDLIVKYYYDLLTYNVTFDANGGTGEMSDMTDLLGGKQYKLTPNRFQKDDSIFTGWNTKADGSGTAYTDQAQVKNLTKENNGTAKLYAQWLSKEDHTLEPTNGEIIVKCKAGESIIIPDLPAGTTYTIEEIDNPAGWTQKGEIESGSGSITPNVTDQAVVTNEYKASGEALVNAHKTLEDADVEYDQFAFELLDENKEVIQTVRNGLTDSNQQVENDEGNFVDNPYYDTAIVRFTALEYDESDIGKTYTYYIREVKEDEVTYEYDDSLIEVQVTVNDFGNGTLGADVRYKDPQTGQFTSGEHIFRNKVNPAKLRISKTIDEGDEIHESEAFKEDQFTFTVTLKNKDGEELTGEYEYFVLDDNGDHVKDDNGNDITGTIRSGGTVAIKGGQTAEITGIPEGSTYEVTEAELENWEQIAPVSDDGAPEGESGELTAGEASQASFTNLYHEPQKAVYFAEGSVQLTAKKRMEGGTILEDDEFTFELVDESDETGESTQTKTCDSVSSNDEAVTESDITFDEIHYDLSQLQYPEAVAEAENAALQFINGKETEYNSIRRPLQQEYNAAKKAYDEAHKDDEEPAEKFKSFDEWYRDEHGGESFPDFDTWFSQQADTDGKTPLKYLNAAVELAQAQNPREGTFIYYVREIAGDDPDVQYDSTRYYYKVKVVDNGDGTLTATPTMYKMGKEEDTEVDEIAFVNSKTTQIKVYKRWEDTDDQDGYRPTAQQFAEMIHLMNGDTEVTNAKPPLITADASGNLTIVYIDLPAYDDQGNKITYTVKEDPVENYTVKNDTGEVENGGTMINFHQPEKVGITVTKEWDDSGDQDGYRLTAEQFAAKVHLYKDGVVVEDAVPETVDNGDGTFTVSYSGLDKFRNHGTQIIYTIKEDSIDNYSAKDGDDEEADGGTITNIHEPDKVSISITKVWDDARDQDGIRPSPQDFAGKVHLYQDGVVLETAVPVVKDNGDGTYTISYTDLDKYHDQGVEYSYKIAEDSVDDYEAVDGVTEAEDKGELKNFHEPKTTSVTVRKIWDDQNDICGRRSGVGASVQLYGQAEGGEKKPYGDAVPVGTEDGWSHTWDGIPLNENGKEIVYTVEESMEDSRYYAVSVGKINEDNVIEVTNTCTVTELMITKKMPEIVTGEGINATLVFEVKGTDSSGEVIYENTVGIVFNEASGEYERKVLKDVPIDAEITVTEIYAGGYEPGEATVTKKRPEASDGKMIWLFEFENYLDGGEDDGRFGDGVVNRYENDSGRVKFKEAEK